MGELLDVSPTTVKRLITSKQLRAFKVTAVWRVSEHDLWVYLRTQRKKAVQEIAELEADTEAPAAAEPKQPELPHHERHPANAAHA